MEKKLLGDEENTFSIVHTVLPTAERLWNGEKGRPNTAFIW
jgi:hypothetical protein